MAGAYGIAEQMGQVAGLGLSGGAGVYTAKYIFDKIFSRWEKKEVLLDTATKTLIVQLQEQVKDFEKRLNEAYSKMDDMHEQLIDCKNQHAETNAELSHLKAQMDLRGVISQEAAKVVAADRMAQVVKGRKDGSAE